MEHSTYDTVLGFIDEQVAEASAKWQNAGSDVQKQNEAFAAAVVLRGLARRIQALEHAEMAAARRKEG